MSFDQDRHDRIFGAAMAVRDHYNALLAVVPESLKQSDHMVLGRHWMDDVEGTILPAARVAVDAKSAAVWLSRAEIVLQQVTMMLEAVKTDLDRTDGAGK
jgi:hypothetical protein